MSIQHHKIGRTVLELNTGQWADVNSLQETVGTLWHSKAQSKIADLFDQMVQSDTVVRLDTVVVELDGLDARYIEDEFVPQLMRSVERCLADHLAGYIPADSPPIVRQSQDEADGEVLLYFLEYGRLPWWCSAQTEASWQDRWTAALVDGSGWLTALRGLLRNDGVRSRLIHQLPESFCRQLIWQLQPRWLHWPDVLAWMQQLNKRLHLSGSASKLLNTQAWLTLLEIVSETSGADAPLPTASWLDRWVPHLVQDVGGSVRERVELEAVFFQQLDELAEGEMVKETIQGLFSGRAGEQALPLETSNAVELGDEEAQTVETAEQRQMREDRLRLQALGRVFDENARSQPDGEAQGIYIAQAGLVLLHPFLPAYFEEVGLVENSAFVNREAQQVALYLLHYLATGETDVAEYALVLPKLLCGWPLDEAVMRGLSVPAGALAEGEHLLQTVLDHWQTLKHTSPDGLREGFLQREGKLTRIEAGWKLWVEQQPIDLLLGRLPWGLSMVTLPWMDGLLTVEWG